MKIYLLTRVDEQGGDNQSFCIVIAESEDQAKEQTLYSGSREWPKSVDKIHATEIGTAHERYKEPEYLVNNFDTDTYIDLSHLRSSFEPGK